MKKNFYPFMLEREMGIWEHQVEYNFPRVVSIQCPPLSSWEMILN